MNATKYWSLLDVVLDVLQAKLPILICFFHVIKVCFIVKF